MDLVPTLRVGMQSPTLCVDRPGPHRCPSSGRRASKTRVGTRGQKGGNLPRRNGPRKPSPLVGEGWGGGAIAQGSWRNKKGINGAVGHPHYFTGQDSPSPINGQRTT